MIERLTESSGGVIAFKAVGHITSQDTEKIEQQIKFLIESRNSRPIGILADLSEFDQMDLAARWEEIRFLQKYTTHIARMAVVGAHTWEKVKSLFVVAAALLQAETLYFEETDIRHAWEWVRSSTHALEPPPPIITAATGIWKDYVPEHM